MLQKHVARTCSKARKLIGLLYRRFHHCSPQLLLRLYKAFVRPHLEYASQVWDPHYVKDVNLLEKKPEVCSACLLQRLVCFVH